MADKEKITLPDFDAQQLLDALIVAESQESSAAGRRIGWIHKSTEQLFTHILAKHSKDDLDKNIVRWYAAARLDRRSGFLTWFFQTLFFGFYWRWLWYVRHERGTYKQVLFVNEIKKKIKTHSDASALLSILMVGATNLTMMTAAHEAGQAGPAGEPATP